MSFNYSRFIRAGIGLGLCSSAVVLAACYGGASSNFPDYGDTAAIEGDKIVTFNRADPAQILTSVSISGLDGQLLGIDYRPLNDLLYGVTANKVYEINSETGVAIEMAPLKTAAGTVVTLDSKVGVNFDPIYDKLRVVSDNGQNVMIGPDTGIAIVDPKINGAASGYHAIALSNSHRTSCNTNIYAIDITTDRLLLQSGRTGATVTVGSLGVDATEVGGFDIVTGVNPKVDTAYANLTVGGVSKFYTINLQTGAATVAGTPAGSYSALTNYVPEGIRPQEFGDVMVTSNVRNIPSGSGNRLFTMASFFHDAPGKVCTSINSQNLLNPFELPQALMFHPDGSLYVFANPTAATTPRAGRVIKVNRFTGEYTFVHWYSGTQFNQGTTGYGAKIDVNNPLQYLIVGAGNSTNASRMYNSVTLANGSLAAGIATHTANSNGPKATLLVNNGVTTTGVSYSPSDLAFDQAGTTIYGLFMDFTPFSTTGSGTPPTNGVIPDQIGSVSAANFLAGTWTTINNAAGIRVANSAGVLTVLDITQSQGGSNSFVSGSGFDIDRKTGQAYLMGPSLTDATNTYLYTIDLATSVLTPVNAGDNRIVQGLTNTNMAIIP